MITLGASPPSFAEDVYQDQIELDLAEQQQRERAAANQTIAPGTRGQVQGVPPVEAAPSRSRFSATASIDFRSQYNSYGVVIQGEGVTIQPFLNLRYSLYDAKNENEFVNNVTAFITTWNDFSTNTNLSRPTSPYGNFTEADLVGGVSVLFADRFNLTVSVTELISPAGGFGPGAFVKAVLLYDDNNLTAPNFGIRPQISAIYELPWQGFIGLAPNAFLFEPGITPNYTFRAGTSSPINVSLPMRLGLGNEFYAGSTYGFFSVGPQVTMRLPGLSNDSLTTNLTLGYLYYNLGPTTADFAPNNNKNQHVFNMGVSVNF